MAKNFNELRTKMYAKMSPEQIKEHEAESQRVIHEYRLDQVRKAQKLTQVALAEKMGTRQAEISKIESRSDLYLSTLREYIHALGGELVLRAEFPNDTINIEI